MNYRNKTALCLIILLFAITVFSGCGLEKAEDLPTQTTVSQVSESTVSESGIFTESDADSENLESSFDTSRQVEIDLGSKSVSSNGAAFSDNILTINRGGYYRLQGTLNGQVHVNADKQDVWLLLDNASIHSSDSSAIFVEDAKSTYIVLSEGSSNSLSDTSVYTTDDSGDPDATLFCKNDLYIGGKGKLVIESNYDCAIHTKDTLVFSQAVLEATSVDAGIKAKDGLKITSGSLELITSGDALKTTNEENASKGLLLIEGGSITINSQGDAITSDNTLKISGGTFNITTGNGSESVDMPEDDMMPMHWQNESTATSESTISRKAIKSQGSAVISGGTFQIDSEDDALHSNADLTISKGDFTLKSGDDGIHADSKLTITDGKINILYSYEGIEGEEINIQGGEIRLLAYDDGMNSAGGNDESYGGYGQADSFRGNSSCKILISGGYIYVDAKGDGIDSNGNLEFSGGTTVVYGAESGANSPLDFQGECIINGGTVVAAGSAQMAESISSASTQQTIVMYLNGTLLSGTMCNISSESYSLSVSPKVNYSYLIVSTTKLTAGDTYTVSFEGSDSGEEKDGLFSDGNYSGGTEAAQITLSSTVTTLGSGGMGGPGMGGGPGGPGGPGAMGGRR